MSNHNAILNLSGTDDPTLVATPAPIGAQYARTDTGQLYMKTGPADTAWTLSANTLEVAVVFDDAVPAARVNIRSDRASNQSPINNAVAQITNFGSQDGFIDPTAVGATAQGATIGGGDDNSATLNYATVAGGGGNRASHLYATVGGGDRNVAQNGRSTISGGQQNLVQADYAAIAGGRDNNVDGDYGSISGGRANIAFGQYGHVGGGQENNINAASGNSVIAGGSFNAAKAGSGLSAIGGGGSNEVFGQLSAIPGGYAVKTRLFGQVAMGAAGFTNTFPPVAGEAQTSILVMRNLTPGVGINETAELMVGDTPTDPLTLEDGKAYAFKVTVSVGGIQAGPSRVSRSIEIRFNARRDAGLTTITAIGASDAYGDVATATWTLAASVGAVPDRIVLTFDTGAGAASACKAVAKVEFTEVAY